MAFVCAQHEIGRFPVLKQCQKTIRFNSKAAAEIEEISDERHIPAPFEVLISLNQRTRR